jgi:hypothetical protein
VVLLETYPRREPGQRSLEFRFFVVLPHEAVLLKRKLEKPLLTSAILTGLFL